MWGRINLVGLVFFMGLAGDALSERIPSPVFLVPDQNGDTARLTTDTVNGVRKRSELDISLLFSGNYLINWARDPSDGSLLAMEEIKYRFSLEEKKRYLFTGQFTHTFAMQHFFDSITRVQADRNTLLFQIDLFPERTFRLAFTLQAETQLFDGYSVVTGSAGIGRQRTSTFLTPLVVTISFGPGLYLKKTGMVKLGISGGKITWLRDKALANRYAQSLYLLPEGKQALVEYGLILSFNADRELLKRLRWSCDLLLFKRYDKPAELNLKNQFSFRITRYLKAMLQTRVLYEDQLSKHLQMENILSVGVSFHR